MVKINGRTVMAPAAAATMALLLFTYTRSSIAQARSQAQNHPASGGLKTQRSAVTDVEEKGGK
jgi:hypothetical protein